MAAQPSMTLDDFKKRLRENYYSDLGGARKGIGRVQGWKDSVKDEARTLAEKHFGGGGGKESAPKKANGKKDKPAKKEKTTRAKGAKAPEAATSSTEASSAAAAEKRVAVVNSIVAAVNGNISVLAVARGQGADPNECAKTATKAQMTLDVCIDNLLGTIRKITPQLQGTPDPAVAQSFGAAVAAANGIPQSTMHLPAVAPQQAG